MLFPYDDGNAKLKEMYDKPAHLALGTGETTMKLEAAYIFNILKHICHWLTKRLLIDFPYPVSSGKSEGQFWKTLKH